MKTKKTHGKEYSKACLQFIHSDICDCMTMTLFLPACALHACSHTGSLRKRKPLIISLLHFLWSSLQVNVTSFFYKIIPYYTLFFSEKLPTVQYATQKMINMVACRLCAFSLITLFIEFMYSFSGTSLSRICWNWQEKIPRILCPWPCKNKFKDSTQ